MFVSFTLFVVIKRKRYLKKEEYKMMQLIIFVTVRNVSDTYVSLTIVLFQHFCWF